MIPAKPLSQAPSVLFKALCHSVLVCISSLTSHCSPSGHTDKLCCLRPLAPALHAQPECWLDFSSFLREGPSLTPWAYVSSVILCCGSSFLMLGSSHFPPSRKLRGGRDHVCLLQCLSLTPSKVPSTWEVREIIPEPYFVCGRQSVRVGFLMGR